MFTCHLCLQYAVLLSSMKQTAEDLRFAGDFAEALRPHVNQARKQGSSLKQVAEELGVSEPALKKYLRGRTTPCLRTVVLAFDKYRVSVPYSGISFIGDAHCKRKPGPKRSSALQQLEFPFEIGIPGADERLTLKLLPTGVSRYQLQVTLRLAT
jgi:transcriptional regulator with XRE-family HTH domain